MKKNNRTIRQRRAFTLIEIMVVIAIIGIIVAIAHNTWLRQREVSRARACQENLTKIDGATEQWALDNSRGDGDPVQLSDLVGPTSYLKGNPSCPAEGDYPDSLAVGSSPTCNYETPAWMPGTIGHFLPEGAGSGN